MSFFVMTHRTQKTDRKRCYQRGDNRRVCRRIVEQNKNRQKHKSSPTSQQCTKKTHYKSDDRQQVINRLYRGIKYHQWPCDSKISASKVQRFLEMGNEEWGKIGRAWCRERG